MIYDMLRPIDKCKDDIILTREEAVSAIFSACKLTPSAEYVPYYEAYGRILAEDVFSETTLPNALTASMDGIAVYFDSFADGIPDTASWVEGRDYVFSNTGIGIDGDFDTEIMIEQVSRDENGAIHIAKAPDFRGQNTIPVGRDLKKGDLIAKKGQRITPITAAMLAKGGHVVLPVTRKPVIAFIPTGNELVPAGIALPLRKNVDANSILMRGKIEEWGAAPLIYPICPDDRAKLRAVLLDAVSKADIVVLNAGSSKGSDDVGHEVIAELGNIINHQVNTVPGKHICYAVINNTPVVGVPGPTGACDSSSEWYVKPLSDRLLGLAEAPYPRLKARILKDLKVNAPVLIMMGGRAEVDEDGGISVMPASGLPRDISPDTRINCYIPVQKIDVHAGDTVEIELKVSGHR